MTKLTVFHKNDCIQCKMTMNMLDAADIPFDTVNIDEQPEVAQQLKDEGFKSAPVVKVEGVGENDAWMGFRIDKIRNYIRKHGTLATNWLMKYV